jgi:hypothetical protein
MLKVRTLTVALFAVLALSVVSVASASAAVEFRAEASPVVVKAKSTETHVFNIGGTKVECSEASFESAATAVPTTKVVVSATYTGCKAFGFASATVKMNKCQYEFVLKNEGPPFKANVNIVNCEAGKSIEITASTCTVKVAGAPSNQNLALVEFINKAEEGGFKKRVEINPKVEHIQYTTNKGFGCPAEGLNGVYTGKTIAHGEAGGKEVGIEVK